MAPEELQRPASSLFAKVLVANRGEIAVRIIQTCRELGIGTVAVFSDADADALHVRLADESYRIGPPAALASYLSIAAVVGAAKASGADAVHPGYGFLAENADFARAVQKAGLVWIGPAPEVIAALGDKIAAKALAVRAGVPIVPGYAGEDLSVAHMLVEAERIGYPVMLKAAAGGGGRGMRAVYAAEDLPDALEGARREAHSGFGDERVFMEKLLVQPRHIEIQILLDQHGNGVSLHERDCSLQRRHQKVVEESPSPVMTPELRAQMGAAALRLARASGYSNAGTVEFLFSGDRFYFLEVNTRIQVEHPVTELVTGLDLIALQMMVAAGMPLPVVQEDVVLRGHAIEVRVYAEDPSKGFLPVTGQVEVFLAPSGAGIRNDTGVQAGSKITPYYDAMLAKLIVHAPNRDQAVARMQQALERYTVSGTVTNLEFLRWVFNNDEVRRGRIDTGFLERTWVEPQPDEVPFGALAAAAAYQSGSSGATAETTDPWRRADGWRTAGLPRVFHFEDGERAYSVSLTGETPVWTARVFGDAAPLVVRQSAPDTFCLDADGLEKYRVAEAADGLRVTWIEGDVLLQWPDADRHQAGASGAPGDAGLTAPMPGTVVKVHVQDGQQVQHHQPLLVMEAMKMEHVIEAPHAGRIRAVLYGVGDMVPAGAPLVRMEAE